MSWSPHLITRSSQERARVEVPQYAYIPRQILSHATSDAKVEHRSAMNMYGAPHGQLQVQRLPVSSKLSPDTVLQSRSYPPAVVFGEVSYQSEQAAILNRAPPLAYANGAWYVLTLV